MKIITAGPTLEDAHAAILMVHGRGASARSILALYPELKIPWCAAIAPQAPVNSWYPQSFLAPMESNQPYLDAALAGLESIINDCLARGLRSEKIAILGFSQGACLSLEFTARHPRRYGAIIGFTGGLIGPAGTPRNYSGSLAGTPVFLGSSDPDPHVPFARVQETSDVLSAMDASVELRRYPGMGHTIDEDELEAARYLLSALNSNQKGKS